MTTPAHREILVEECEKRGIPYEAIVVAIREAALAAMARVAPSPDYVPTMDAAMRFMRSNPVTSWEMMLEILNLGSEDNAPASGGRFRELWKLSGGAFKNGKAWVEVDTLPFVLRRLIDVINALPPLPEGEKP